MEELETAEYKLLCRAVHEASSLLANDDPAAGYRCLLEGLERAREYCDSGEPWAEPLAASYQSALFYYGCLYPVSGRIPMSRAAEPRTASAAQRRLAESGWQ